ncbi:MAG TPA: integrase, partial [Actinomycetota bacterium]|nr:integrase [Actinomycetota bacterium]
MPRAPGSVPAASSGIFGAFVSYLEATGRSNGLYEQAARRFLVRWADPQAWAARPLKARLGGDVHQRPFLMFLMLHGHLHPGYDFLLARRKLPSLWREVPHSPLAEDLRRFAAGAAELGFSERVCSGLGSQVVARLLIQTGRGLASLTGDDLQELAAACQHRQERTGIGWRHYSSAIYTTRQVLFHLGVLANPPPNALARLRQDFERRMAPIPASIRQSFVAYLERLSATHARASVTGTATRLAHFGRHLGAVDPGLACLADLDRRRHIESYLSAVAEARSSRHGEPISASERRGRVL